MAESKIVDKTKFDNSWYKPGPFWKRTLWYYVSIVIFQSYWFPFYKMKAFILRLFGAKLGKRFQVKPCVTIKYPWFLEAGDYVGIGEDAWIDNLAKVTLGDSVTISQGALLITGNHNYKSESFDLMLGEITLGPGVWVGAKAIVGPGVTIGRNSILSLGSMTTEALPADGIYAGRPAVFVKARVIA